MANVENLDLIIKLIFVQIVAIELQGLQSHLSEIRKADGQTNTDESDSTMYQ